MEQITEIQNKLQKRKWEGSGILTVNYISTASLARGRMAQYASYGIYVGTMTSYQNVPKRDHTAFWDRLGGTKYMETGVKYVKE
jgi:hypothetical protein